jgi:hypothetical protein
MPIVQKPVYFSLNMEGHGSEGFQEVDFKETVRAAWWSPYDNIADISKVHNITLTPNGSKVRVSYTTNPGISLQVQIIVSAEITK